MVFLSFNSSITAPEDIADDHDDDQDTALPESLPLRHKWVVWQQLMAAGAKTVPYGQSTKQIATVETVEEFWRTWDLLPQPSELITRRMVQKESSDNILTVDALMFFRDGVLPQWEDAANQEGGHFQFQLKSSIGGAQIDEYWNNLVLATVGDTMEPAGMITGMRLVDKLSAKGNTPGVIRMEVWFDSVADQEAVQLLQRNIERCMATRTLEGRLGIAPKVELKNHKMTRHQ
eukprot:gb/GFBE01058454.1/.p1 GENE.gb/GFBE01058454.1/~~gb/GFBE01058454.1/.p1  ORF type:complete len:232 (+),score=38.26 gb/GFBE01058454.1/:1-696(+)